MTGPSKVLGFGLVLAIATVACDAPRRGRHTDAGGGSAGGNAGGGGSSDAGDGTGGGGGGGPSYCTPGNTYCDGVNVRECDPAGKPGPVVDSCTGGMACSNGRCTSPECATAESKQSVVGCLFYALDTDNTEYDDKQVFGFPVGNPGTSPVDVKVERANPSGWETMVMAKVNAGEINYLRLASGAAAGKDWHVEGTGQERKAYRISSEQPIVAYTDNADDENGASANSGSTILLPIHALGRQYYAITPAERGLKGSGSGFGTGGPDHAFVSVVGTKSGTKVKVTVTGSTMAGGPIPSMKAGDVYEATIDEGEVINIETNETGSDLSGSLVESDKPVTVFAGNVCGGFDPARLAQQDCDHIEEEMFPINTWGRSFVVLDMRMPMHGASSDVWALIVASEDGTELSFDSPKAGGWKGLPAGTVALDKGQMFKVTVSEPVGGYTGTPFAHYTVQSNKPVGIVSYMGTQEGGAWVVPVDQFLDDYLVSAHPWFTGYLMVTRMAGTPVTLDGTPMSDSQFKDAGGGFEVSFVAMPRCETSLSKCGHRVEGAKVGVTLTANGGVCNYCYAGGAGARCVNKTAGCR